MVRLGFTMRIWTFKILMGDLACITFIGMHCQVISPEGLAGSRGRFYLVIDSGVALMPL